MHWLQYPALWVRSLKPLLTEASDLSRDRMVLAKQRSHCTDIQPATMGLSIATFLLA
ncbi:MAG: hypothetical protein RBJ76_18445 [Stenomitos frigidus ULC029]